MYLLTGDIKLVCTLSFTFKSNCGINLKTLLECMNRQYFFPFYTKIKKKKMKVSKSHFFFFLISLRVFFLFFLQGTLAIKFKRPSKKFFISCSRWKTLRDLINNQVLTIIVQVCENFILLSIVMNSKKL